MLTAEYQAQLKMLDKPRESLKSVRSVEMRKGVLFLKAEDGYIFYRKLSDQQIGKIKRAHQVYETSNDPSLLKRQFTRAIKAALAFPAHDQSLGYLIPGGDNAVRLGKLDSDHRKEALSLISEFDFTDFFEGRVLKLFSLTVKNNKLQIVLQGPYITERELSGLAKQLLDAGLVAHYALAYFTIASTIGEKPYYRLATTNSSEEIGPETLRLARHILLRKGVPETEIHTEKSYQSYQQMIDRAVAKYGEFL